MTLLRPPSLSFAVTLAAFVLLAPAPHSLAQPEHPPAPAARDGQRDFDFDLGRWRTRTSRLKHPLTEATNPKDPKAWSEMEGITTVKPVWDGSANLAVLESDGPAGHLELLALRMYNPQSHQWNLNFATSNAGIPSVPMLGEFNNGIGEFYDQEEYNGRAILVRFRMWSISANSAQSEQAFSADGGKTWETNWINRYTRIPDEPTWASR